VRDAEREPGFVAALLIGLIRFVALLISLAVWAVIGFLYWIPMLVFAIVRFSALVVYTTSPESIRLRSALNWTGRSGSTSKASRTSSWP